MDEKATLHHYLRTRRAQLLAKIDDVEAFDPRIAQGLRGLAEGFQYQKLLDLLSTGTSVEFADA